MDENGRAAIKYTIKSGQAVAEGKISHRGRADARKKANPRDKVISSRGKDQDYFVGDFDMAQGRVSRLAPHSRTSGLRGLQAFELGAQFLRAFAPGRIEGNAVDRAHLLALGFVEMADAFGALVGVDLVNLGAHGNGVVRALGLAHVAIDAVVGNH
jgi:hypothetical protein